MSFKTKMKQRIRTRRPHPQESITEFQASQFEVIDSNELKMLTNLVHDVREFFDALDDEPTSKGYHMRLGRKRATMRVSLLAFDCRDVRIIQ